MEKGEVSYKMEWLLSFWGVEGQLLEWISVYLRGSNLSEWNSKMI